MGKVETLFVTRIYRGRIGGRALIGDVAAVARSLAADDEAGRRWCAKNGYPGYTSYASLNDLAWRFPPFAALAARLEPHVAAFAEALDYDLGGKPLALDSLWVNVLEPGGAHGSHIHPHAAVSGTYYVEAPHGASALKLEDPRLGLMMCAPPRRARAGRDHAPHVALAPRPGDVILWESFVRHEVPPNRAKSERISVSFNYAWR
jgi:uncharacterized protein (TIGR02466 family)